MSKDYVVLLTNQQIQDRIDTLSEEIESYYRSRLIDSLVIIGLLNGVYYFMSDLTKRFRLSCEIDFMKISSYDGKNRADLNIKYAHDIKNISEKHVLLLDDVFDSMNTISEAIKIIQMENPLSISICALLDKPQKHEAKISNNIKKFIGFPIDDLFVAGYGLDDENKINGTKFNRNRPFIYICN